MTPTIDQMPPGWFVLDVMRSRARYWDWVALAVDQPGDRATAGAFVRIPGKHRNRDAAWEMFEAMIATKH